MHEDNCDSATDDIGTKTSANVRGGLSSWTISFFAAAALALLLLLQSTISVQTRRTLAADKVKVELPHSASRVSWASQSVRQLKLVCSVLYQEKIRLTKSLMNCDY